MRARRRCAVDRGVGDREGRRRAAAAATATPPQRACSACAAVERCDEATGACLPACPAGEVYIPATGPDGFVMGKGITTHATRMHLGKGHMADSDIPHRVVLTKPFCLDETEVTVAAMKACVDARACRSPKFTEVFANYPKKLDHPVNEVSWPKAKAYCAYVDKHLPTEAQWEWAATGGDGRTWPWGEEQPTCEFADFVIGPLVSPGGDSGCNGGGTSPVKSHPRGNKVWPGGPLYDMAGNVWEWCEDSYKAYSKEPAVDPFVIVTGSIVHSIRGGGWNRSAPGIASAFRGGAVESYEVPGLGFRCARGG